MPEDAEPRRQLLLTSNELELIREALDDYSAIDDEESALVQQLQTTIDRILATW